MQEFLSIVKLFTEPVLPVEGQRARVYVIIENKSQKDFFGNVILDCHNKVLGGQQVVSIFSRGQDGVWFDGIVPDGGVVDCDIKIKDQSTGNTIVKESSFVAEGDNDLDGAGDNSDPDDDNDSVIDTEELKLGTNPKNPDTDNDGVLDKTDLFPLDKTEWEDNDNDKIGDNSDPDDDNDDLSDIEETRLGANPKNQDTDGDRVSDAEEIRLGTNILNKDTDDDGMLDGEEIKIGIDPNNRDSDGDGTIDSKDPSPLDGNISDTDGDGVPDSDEIKNGTNPNLHDSDGDGIEDKLDPFPTNADYKLDTNQNRIPDESEKKYDLDENTNYENDDYDHDGVLTRDEILIYNSDPKDKDTDDDGVLDGEEVNLTTSLNSFDTDSDGVSDKNDKYPNDNKNGLGDEDNDGIISKIELSNYLNPKDPNTYFIKDKYSYHIIKYWVWYLVGIFIFFIFIKINRSKTQEMDTRNIGKVYRHKKK